MSQLPFQPLGEKDDGERYERKKNQPEQHAKPYRQLVEPRLLFLLTPPLRFLDGAAFSLTLWGMVSSYGDLLSKVFLITGA